MADHWKKFYTSITNTELFPDPSESSVADDIAHNLATQEIIGVGEKHTNVARFFLFEAVTSSKLSIRDNKTKFFPR